MWGVAAYPEALHVTTETRSFHVNEGLREGREKPPQDINSSSWVPDSTTQLSPTTQRCLPWQVGHHALPHRLATILSPQQAPMLLGQHYQEPVHRVED